jgi:hypothetical protein
MQGLPSGLLASWTGVFLVAPRPTLCLLLHALTTGYCFFRTVWLDSPNQVASVSCLSGLAMLFLIGLMEANVLLSNLVLAGSQAKGENQ